MDIVNGTGLKIKAHAGSYGGASRTAPLIWLPFSQISPSINFTLMSALRIWVYVSAISGTFGNGDNLFCGVDTGSTAHGIWQGWGFPIGSPSPLQLTIGRFVNGVASNGITGGGQGNQDWTNDKMMVLHTDRQVPNGQSSPWLSMAPNAAAGWPNVQTGLTPFYSLDATTSFGALSPQYAPSNMLTGYGIVLGEAGVGNDPIWTVARIRVDYRP